MYISGFLLLLTLNYRTFLFFYHSILIYHPSVFLSLLFLGMLWRFCNVSFFKRKKKKKKNYNHQGTVNTHRTVLYNDTRQDNGLENTKYLSKRYMETQFL
jgi:hypothetical protein